MNRQQRDEQARVALDAARLHGYGPDTPLAVRDPAMARLQSGGCYLAEIGQLFGINRETVRRRIARLRHAARAADAH
jgi:DNA-binding CsgD family transcriptional regulator